jgi:hypothetical protein
MGANGRSPHPERRGGSVFAEKPARRRRALGIAARGGIVYLTVAWVVLKLVAPNLEAGAGNEPLAWAAVFGLLAGLPVIAVVARRFGPVSGEAAALWGPGLLAAISGLAVSSLCVTTASTPPSASSGLPAYVPASLRSGGQLRLRIDGLTVSGVRPPDPTTGDSEAELVISTRMIERGPDSGLLEVRARLVDGRGEILWERCDAVDPDDGKGLHRAVLRALAEGMALTGQGGGTIAGRPQHAHRPLA